MYVKYKQKQIELIKTNYKHFMITFRIYIYDSHINNFFSVDKY